MNILSDTMLSFELSAIDLILAVAVIILLLLYITKSSAKTLAEEKLLLRKRDSSRERTIEDASPEEEIERLAPKPQTDSTQCPYGFGYLKKIDKATSIPDECLNCSRIMECYSANE